MIDSNFLENALLMHNYFPVQKKLREEMPPIFNSEHLTQKVSEDLRKTKPRMGGYDQVMYRSTRFNNVTRQLTIPHPQAYVFLVNEIVSNWDSIKHICSNKSSIIRPKKHKDGRVIIMDYDSSHKSSLRHLKLSLGRKFVVHSDISNFFPSIYTHSVPWALVGLKDAKLTKMDKKKWYNQIDKSLQTIKRDETAGVAIGPATSNIVSESILFKVDKSLTQKGYVFTRFIDDYTSYCNTYEESEEFIRLLSSELSKYKLQLNIKKTFINKLPESTSSDWVSELSLKIPKGNKIGASEAIKFLDHAISVQNNHEGGSVLKFAVKSIVNKLHFTANIYVFKYVLNLAYHYPVLLPTLDALMENCSLANNNGLHDHLINFLHESSRLNQSDSMCWIFII